MRNNQRVISHTKVRAGLLILLPLVFLMVNSCDVVVTKPLFKVEPLPYGETDLEPYMSAGTLQYHYGTHYPGYVEAANRLTRTSRFKGKSFEKVVALIKDRQEDTETFNQVGQAWNHAFFFKSLKPGGGGAPPAQLAQKIGRDFGSLDKFKKAFAASAKKQFGSGWVWLVLDGRQMKIMNTANGDTPAAHRMQPLFVVDVWEHAYYLDYRNRRAEYVETVLDKLVNWEHVAAQLETALSKDK